MARHTRSDDPGSVLRHRRTLRQRLFSSTRLRATAIGIALLAAIAGTAVAFAGGDDTPIAPTAQTREDDRASRGEQRATPTTTPSVTTTPTPSATPSATRTPTKAPTTKATAKIAIPASCSAYTGNRAIACALLPSYGFSLSQMPALDKLWQKESGWNHKAENPSSGAYGIPQALPGSKMGTVASDWRTNPATQIKWGLGYIKSRYGTPANAWSFWQAHNWY